MSAKKPNISQINKYLQGKLDARAMHQLERQAQDDPFLMDALEGYEKAGKNQQANLADLKAKLDKRTAPAKQRSIILWRVLPIAATVLLMLGAGYWFLKSPEPATNQYANVIDKSKKDTALETIIKQNDSVAITDDKAHKPDHKEYIASNYAVKPNATVDDILKKMDGVEVSPDGSITYDGQAVASAKLNGKDFAGGNVSNAIKNLPADIVENLQIVDDYGDQAARTGVRDGNPAKVLNITTDTTKRDLIAVNRAAAVQVLREVAINSPEKQTNERTVSGKVLDQQGAPLIGATVKVDGTDKGVATDVDGNFKIELPANKDLLAVNYIGYNTQQVKLGSQDNLNISLKPVDNSLNEVVVSGFSKKTKAVSTACKENLKFKKLFFEHITTVEKYTNAQLNATKQTIKPAVFKKALSFLIKYTRIPANATEYKSLSSFETDKNHWLKWYEDNKCNNLK